MATVTEAYCISEGSGKETNHYVVSLKGSGIECKPGDSLGFYPTNDFELVKQTIRKIKARRNDLIDTKETGETQLAGQQFGLQDKYWRKLGLHENRIQGF